MNCESNLSHKCVTANYYRAVTVSIIKPSTCQRPPDTEPQELSLVPQGLAKGGGQILGLPGSSGVKSRHG